MKKIIGVGLLALVLVGCQKPGGTRGGAAVIDLDRVASTMGWLDELNKNLQSADTELRAQLDQVLRGNLKSIEDMKAEVAADAKLTPDQIKTLNSVQDLRELEKLPLTKEQKEKLTGVVNQANANWQRALNGSQQAMQQRRAALIMGCREKIRPFVRRVAAERGVTVVFTTSDNLVYVDPQAADLTEAVIDQMLKAPGELRATTPAAPAPSK
jgi:Skp family chaperone for outer membrane proteins